MAIKSKTLKSKIDSTVDRSYCITQNSDKCKRLDGFRLIGDFYVNHSSLFPSAVTPICKDCLKDMVYESDGTVNKDKFLRALSLIDKPFIQQHYESSLKAHHQKKLDFWGGYIGLLARFNSDMTFNDGDELFEKRIKYELDEAPITFDDLIISKAMILKWGKGLEKKDYAFLEYNYNRLKNDYEYEGYASDIIFVEISQIMLAIAKERESKNTDQKTLNDLNNSLRQTLKTANLKPDSKLKQGEEVQSMGMFIKKIETTSPAEEKMDDRFRDKDKIRKYFEEFFVEPLKNGVG